MGKILTQAALDALTPALKRREIPDAKVSGLHHVIQPSGARSWALRYRFAGRNTKLTIGRYPEIGIADARRKATVARAEISNGMDPARQKQEAKAEAKAKASEIAQALDVVETVTRTYIATHSKVKTRPRTVRETERIIDHDILPFRPKGSSTDWRTRRLSSITRVEANALLDGIVARGKPFMANRVHEVLKALGRWAAERGIVERSPFEHLRPPAKELPRERVLTVPEIKALLAALDEKAYPVKQLVMMLLLTGARRAEVAQMKWAEVDLEAKVWTLPRERSKNGHELVLPLSEALIDMLRGLPGFGKNPYVFSFGGRGPVANFKWKNRLDAAMAARLGEGFTPWRLHDLRRSAASGMAEIGIAPHVVERVLNHRSGVIKGVSAVYNRFSYQPEMRAALEAWSRRVDEIVSGETASNVVALRGRP